MINSGDCFKCPFKHRPQSPMTHFSIVSWSLTLKGCFISFLDSFPPSWMLGPQASLESVVESWRSTPFWDVWNRFFRFSREKKAPTTNSRVRTPEKRTAVAFVLVGTYVHHIYERRPKRQSTALCRMISLTALTCASAYALVLLQFAYASLRNSGFALPEASYDTTLSTHVKGGLVRCSYMSHLFFVDENLGMLLISTWLPWKL